jgi:hypothetical protein
MLCADFVDEIDHTPESAGLRAISSGFPLVSRDDHEPLERATFLYDALYAHLRRAPRRCTMTIRELQAPVLRTDQLVLHGATTHRHGAEREQLGAGREQGLEHGRAVIARWRRPARDEFRVEHL